MKFNSEFRKDIGLLELYSDSAGISIKFVYEEFLAPGASMELLNELIITDYKGDLNFLFTGNPKYLKERVPTDNKSIDEDLSNEDIKDIAEILQKSKVKGLTLVLRGLSDARVKAIVDAQKNKPTLKMLHLFLNTLGDEGVKAIFELLNLNTLNTLYLAGNHIGAQRVQSIVAGLQNNKTLKSFGLTSNGLGDEGGVIVAENLANNTILEKLNLCDNNLAAKTGQAIIKALETNMTLQQILLENNQIDATTQATINRLLDRNRNIAKKKKFEKILEQVHNNTYRAEVQNRSKTILDLSQYSLNPAVAKSLVEALLTNPTIRELHLHLTLTNVQEEIMALVFIIIANKTLKSIKLSHDKGWFLDVPHLQLIAAALEFNTSLTKFTWPKKPETQSEIAVDKEKETQLQAIKEKIWKYLQRNAHAPKTLTFSTSSPSLPPSTAAAPSTLPASPAAAFTSTTATKSARKK